MLGRASLSALIVVPILAALWPSIRIVVNQYNEAAGNATAALESAAERVGALLPEDRPSDSNEIDRQRTDPTSLAAATLQRETERLAATITDLSRDYQPRTIDSPGFPLSWVLLFFAALASLVGHAYFRAFAPDIVREHSLLQFMEHEWNTANRRTQGGLVDPDEAAESGAKAYLEVAMTDPVNRLICGSLFLISIGLVVSVLLIQSHAVLDAAVGRG